MELFRREIAQVGFHSYLMVTAVDGRDFKRRLLARAGIANGPQFMQSKT